METPPNKCQLNDCFRVIRGWYDLTFVINESAITVMSVVSVLGVMRVVRAPIIIEV